MRKKTLLGVVAFAVIAMMLIMGLAGCGSDESADSESKLIVATGSTLIAGIVETVGGDLVDVVNIVPPGMCPGHFDCSPEDIKNITDADVFIMHDWQDEKFIDSLLSEPEKSGTDVKILDVQGNWMTPPVRKEAADEITEILSKEDPDNASTFEKNNKALDVEADRVGKEQKEKLAAVAGTKALCSEYQQGFLSWAGFDVLKAYGTPDSLTPDVLKELVDIGRNQGAQIVVDNLQSGPDAGENIAVELGIPHVALSNFPGGFGEDDSTWEEAIEKNVQILLVALGK